MESSSRSSLDDIRETLVGRWKVDTGRDEHLEEFLTELGVNFVFRKLIRIVKPSSDIIVAGDDVTITFNAGFITSRETFKLNEEFINTFQGVKRKATATFKDGQLAVHMVPYGTKSKPMTHIRKRAGDDLLLTMCIGEVRCKRYMKRL